MVWRPFCLLILLKWKSVVKKIVQLFIINWSRHIFRFTLRALKIKFVYQAKLKIINIYISETIDGFSNIPDFINEIFVSQFAVVVKYLNINVMIECSGYILHS